MSTPPLTNATQAPITTLEAVPASPILTVVPPGVGSGNSTIVPATDSSSSNVAALPPVGVLTDIALTPAEVPPASAKGIIRIEKKGLFGLGKTSTKEVSLDTALEKKMITPQQAVEKGHCTTDYLKARGYENVKFNYAGKRGEVAYDGDLKTALKKGYITIEKAIERNFITKEQAIEGGFLKG